MWCTRCHADVAAELAENGQALHCASCGHEIQKIYTPSLHPETRTARELLERWSREERIAPPPPASLTPAASDDLAPSAPPARAPLTAGELPLVADELDQLEPLPALQPPAARVAPTTRQEPTPSRLISTNITAAPAPQPLPLVAPALATEPPPLRDSVPQSQEAQVPSGESTAGEATDGKPRRKLERPLMSRTVKPKGVWRADSAHVPATDSAGDEIPRSVASLESIDTQPPSPSSPPVRPPRASFAALAASLGVNPPVPAAPAAAPPAFSSAAKPMEVASRSEPNRAERATSPVSSEVRSGSTSERSASRPQKLRRRIDPAQSGPAQPPRPHFDLQTYLEQNPQRVGRSETLWGQLVAYAGVAVLTIGTTMVLWGYFGGLGRYTSTGFLISTAGQMLLFLGVVTLVSGGMQQTSHEVTTRVEYLGDRMIRMEQATQQVLRSPHFARRRNRRSRPTSDLSVPRSDASDAA